MKNGHSLFRKITYSFSILFHIVIGVFAIIVANQNIPDKTVLLSVLIILGSVPHLLIYISDRLKLSYLIIGIVGIAFGVLFLTTDIFTDDQICMVWGVIDICRGLTEIVNVVPHIKENKLTFVEIAVSVGDIVIGVLLCIHMLGGIKLHLIYLGIAFLITAAKDVADYIVGKRINAKRTNNN